MMMTQEFTTLRFAYTWGPGSLSETVLFLYAGDGDNEGPVDSISVKKTGSAQWVEYPSSKVPLRGFVTYITRFGSVDNVSVY